MAKGSRTLSRRKSDNLRKSILYILDKKMGLELDEIVRFFYHVFRLYSHGRVGSRIVYTEASDEEKRIIEQSSRCPMFIPMTAVWILELLVNHPKPDDILAGMILFRLELLPEILVCMRRPEFYLKWVCKMECQLRWRILRISEEPDTDRPHSANMWANSEKQTLAEYALED